ncbi:methyltransferase domain-containing protein [Actinomadura sp. ATCC 31491]|uniref:Protein-L-isoaspartate O-methyltransferase n=1 Tax=Actinomadura luzonensis TaxID=2805427 RepID=A0ABT0G3D4_9ACTN|nr:methyltransferase domain-containing protein [Actinomadura luzonensis]MCK2219117.1 methyltransferase domain-containing protein [Actinomadura luzonensis]
MTLLRERQDVGEPVAAAFLAVPRHLFVPGTDPAGAYRDEPIVTKRDAAGQPISSSSQPAIMATMLGQLAVAPGHRVLEIGAGTGYNAALLARLAAPGGHVVSVDIDEDTAARAREHLAVAGVSGVEVVCGDGGEGHAAGAPYDRLIATVGVWDLPPAWPAQLRPDGRLVVPLDLRGVQVSVAFERDPGGDGEGGRWVSRSVRPCGFMRMRGPHAGPEALVPLRAGDAGLTLRLPEPRELGDLGAALAARPTGIRTEVRTGPAGPEGTAVIATSVALWLALHEPRWCVLSGYGAERGGRPTITAGLAEAGGLAVLAAEDAGPGEDVLVARGYGEDAPRLAAELAGHVAAWDAAGRPHAGRLRVTAHPGPRAPAAGTVIRKRHTTLELAFT